MKKLLTLLAVLWSLAAQAQNPNLLSDNGEFVNLFGLANVFSAFQTFNGGISVSSGIIIKGAIVGSVSISADSTNSFMNLNTGSNGVVFNAAGAFTPLVIGEAGGYNVISLNNMNNGTSGLGIFGGANGDNLNLYYMAPAGGGHQWRANGAPIAFLNGAGGLTLGNPGTLQGVLGLAGTASGQFLFSPGNSTATTVNIGPLVQITNGGLISNNATLASTVVGLSILGTTTASHSGDTSDGAVAINGIITANSATNELVYRAMSLTGGNNLTGGGHVQAFRIMDITANTFSGATSDELDGLFFENVNSGTVTTGAAIRIANWPGATKNTIWDTSGGNWVNSGALTLGAPGGASGTITLFGASSGSGQVFVNSTGQIGLAGQGGQVFILAGGGANAKLVLTGLTSGQLHMDTSTTGGHLTYINSTGTAPTLTAGCNGAGSLVNGVDLSGLVTGQTAAATTCTLSFGVTYGAAPFCVATGQTSPLTGAVQVTTTAITVTFASTANYKWSYFCPGI